MLKFLFIYVFVWWMVLFPMLSYGTHVPNKQKVKGADRGAPEKKHLPLKFLITSVVSLIITAIIYYVIEVQQINAYPE